MEKDNQVVGKADPVDTTKDIEKNTVISTNTEDETKKVVARVSLSQLFSTAEPLDYLLMFLGTIGGIICGFSIPFFNVLFGIMLDGLNKNPNNFSGAINQTAIAFAVVAAINLLTGYLQVALWGITGARQTQKLREAYIRSVLSQEVGWFDTVGASELSTRMADIIGKIEDGIGRKIGDLLQYVCQLIGAFVVGFYLCWELTVVLLATFPIIAMAGAFMISAISSALQKSLEQYGKAGGLATETLSAIRTVTALNAQVDAINKYRAFILEAMQVGIRKGLNVGLGNGLLFGVCFGTYGLGFWYGAKLVADDLRSGCDANCLSGGTILSVFFSVIMGSMALGQIAPPLTAFTSARAAAVPLFEVINRKPLIDGLSNTGNIPTTPLKGEIVLKDINFAYPSRPNIQVCKNYNLTIQPGETVALVGPSGCGKSTIVNLLLRFYDPQSGQVLFDGIDIKTLNTRWLRSTMGYVGQEPIVFSGTIADNISYGIDKELIIAVGKEDELKDLRERVITAAKLANAHDFIMTFPDGYETDVGSNGVALSGGQKQRIAIARALIRHPKVLLLDEATSALDATSERIVQESIDKLQDSKAQTTIIIAHRLSTIRNADKIAVINNGVVVEMGKHDELVQMNGLYADLIRLQMTTGGDAEILASSRSIMASNMSLDALENAATEAKNEADTKKAEEEAVVVATSSTSKYMNDAASDAPLTAEETKMLKKKIWEMVWVNKYWFIASVLGAGLFGSIFPVWGLLLAKTQTMFYLSDPKAITDRAAILSISYACLGVAAIVGSVFQFWGIGQLGERIAARLRSDLFEALLRREISFFDYEENNIGALTTRLSDDSRQVNKATSEALAKQIQAFFTLVIGVALGFSASWKVAFVVIAIFPVNIFASMIQMQAISGQGYDHDDGTKTPAGGKKPSPKDKDKKKKKKEDDKTKPAPQSGGSHGALISTAFTHMRTVSAFSMQFHVTKEYSRLTRIITQRRAGRAHMAGFGFGGSQCALFSTYALLFWYGSTLIESGEITFEDMMTAILCLMLGALGMGQAMGNIADQMTGLKAAKRIFDAVEEGKDSPIDGLSDSGVLPTERSKGRIELKNVFFKYPTRPKVTVCKDYNLVIEPGEVVALVGPSGGGKSTIMSLLLRFYDPLDGEVLLDGVDIKTLNVKWLRSQIGYVGQEPVLFSGSIAENIAKGRAIVQKSDSSTLMSLDAAMAKSDEVTGIFGKAAVFEKPKSANDNASQPKTNAYTSVANNDHEDVEIGKIYPPQSEESAQYNDGPNSPAASKRGILKDKSQREAKTMGVDSDIIEASILSNAHDFIKTFTNGYHTDVGEGSVMVSGGQKQRIAIARALIRQPSVLLLDEATSALDANSEKLVQESIDLLTENKSQTTIIIAHRLTTIRNADKIAVINNGMVVEMGKHDELLALGGLYAQLWSKQGGEQHSE